MEDKHECNIIFTKLPGVKEIKVVSTQEAITAAIQNAITKRLMLTFEDVGEEHEGKPVKKKVTLWPQDISHIEQVIY